MRPERIVFLLAVAGCASGAPTFSRTDPDELLAEDRLALAREASGYTDGERAAARDHFDRFVFPWTRDLAGIRFPEKKAKALLVRMHGPSGPLKIYDARATSLRDVLEAGRYNCVSASVFYNLAAERIGVDAIGELLPTHARSLVRVPGTAQPVVVETTSPVGFDPPAEVSARILAQVAAGISDPEARPLVPDGGIQVATRVLIAAIWVNRASLLQERGDIEAAAALFEEGESLAPDESMRAVLRDQRVALLSQLAAADALSGEPARIERGFQTMLASFEHSPSDPGIRRIVSRNFRVVVERYVAQLAGAGRESEALDRIPELTRARLLVEEAPALRAFTLGEVARARSARGDAASALTAMDAALAEPLGAREVALRATLEHNHWQLLRRAVANAAKTGDEAMLEKLFRRAETAAGRGEGRRAELERDRRLAFSMLGQKKLEAGDPRGAAQILREAVRRYTADATLRHNLLVALQRLWTSLADAGRCEEAGTLWDEAERTEPSSLLPGQSRARCYTIKANQRLEAQDFEEAASWLAMAAKASPSAKSIDENLGALLLRWARSARSACPRIVENARELLTRGPTSTAQSRAESALRACER